MKLALGIEPDVVRSVGEIIRPRPYRRAAGLHPPIVARKAEPARTRIWTGDDGSGTGLQEHICRDERDAVHTRLIVVCGDKQCCDAGSRLVGAACGNVSRPTAVGLNGSQLLGAGGLGIPTVG